MRLRNLRRRIANVSIGIAAYAALLVYLGAAVMFETAFAIVLVLVAVFAIAISLK